MLSYIGANLTHDASICQVTNGSIDWFVEEERYSGIKHDTYPLTSAIEVDMSPNTNKNIQTSGLFEPHDKDSLNNIAKSFTKILEKKYAKTVSLNDHEDFRFVTYDEHHAFHAAAGFYNSGFDRAAVLVVDGMGNMLQESTSYHELESIYNAQYPNLFRRHHVGVMPTFLESYDKQLVVGIGAVYQSMSNYFGFGDFGSGKLMGLSSYGVDDVNIKSFLLNESTLDSDLFYRTRFGLKFLPYDYVKYPKGIDRFLDLDDDMKTRFSNLAYRIQKDFETYMSNLILTTLRLTGESNIVLTGGCALNCVANYEYLKVLPDGVKIFIDPICTDAGTSIGLAKLNYYSDTKSTTKHKLKTLYLGKQR